MAMSSKPGKLPLWLTILCLCIIVLAGAYHAQKLFGFDLITENGLSFSSSPIDHKQELRAQFGEYREGRISARDMLKACLDKVQYDEKDAVNGKSALAEYIYALRSQVYLDQGNPQAALAEAQKAAAMAPSPGRGVVALGDALWALSRDNEAAWAYRQATGNPDYVPDYTVEDPMSSQTLDVLLFSDVGAVKYKEYENIIVCGKLIALELAELGQPSFILEGCKPNRIVVCSLKQYDIPSKIKNLIDSYVVELAQVCGLSAAMLPGDKLITLMGGETYPFGITFIDDSEIIKISP